jgi:hypothetical protein
MSMIYWVATDDPSVSLGVKTFSGTHDQILRSGSDCLQRKSPCGVLSDERADLSCLSVFLKPIDIYEFLNMINTS